MISSIYGRKIIKTDYELTGNIDNDKVIIPKILQEAMIVHEQNVEAYKANESWYFNDTKSILSKVKHIRADVDNRFTFNTPKTTVRMNNGYCFGTPFKYVVNEQDENKRKAMQAFVKNLEACNHEYNTMECADKTAIYGISYKLACDVDEEDIKNGMFFRITTEDIDNNKTFIVYSNDIPRREVLGVIFYEKQENIGTSEEKQVTIYNCWTKWHKWIFKQDAGSDNYTNQPFNVLIAETLMQLDAYPLNLTLRDGKAVTNEGVIPLQEYQRTSDRTSDFEDQLNLMNAINVLSCCRVDAVQETSDYILKLRDIDVGEFDENGENPVLDLIKKCLQENILAFKSNQGAIVQPEADILDVPLNQTEVQTLQDFLWSKLEEGLMLPSRTSGVGQDTGIAIENKNGFRQLENNGAVITASAIKSERRFLAKLLAIAKKHSDCPFKDLNISDIEIKPMRNRSENLTTSTNAYSLLRKSGVNPHTAYSVTGLVADIEDTVKADERYQAKEDKRIMAMEKSKIKETAPIKEPKIDIKSK